MRRKRKAVAVKPIRRTVRRKKNPATRARKIYRVAGESLYRQRPVFYSRDGRIVGKKLGKRTSRKKLNPNKGVYVMARRKKRKVSRRRTRRNPVMYKARRRRVRRNPVSGGVFAQTMNILLQGLVTSGSMVGGLYIGKALADMIAGSGTTAPDPAKKAQYRNLSRALLTLAGAVLLPKFAPKFAESIVSGLFASTTLGFMNTSFGLNLGELAGEDYRPGLLYGGPSFDVNSQMQIGASDWELPEFSGVSDFSGVNDF